MTLTPGGATERPWWVEYPLRIVGTDAKGTMPIADMRGWGHLTGKGHGALGLSESEAIIIQEANAALIVAAVNSYNPSPDSKLEAYRKALEELQQAETSYRMTHDLDGAGHINTGRAWDALRNAGMRARKALAAGG